MLIKILLKVDALIEFAILIFWWYFKVCDYIGIMSIADFILI